MKNASYIIGAILFLIVGGVGIVYVSYFLKNSVASDAAQKVVKNYFDAVEIGDASSSALYLTSALKSADPNLYQEEITLFGSIKIVTQSSAGKYTVTPSGETYTYNAAITSADGVTSGATIQLVKQGANWYINSITEVPSVKSPFGQ